MKRPPAAGRVTISLSAWEVRLLRRYASRHWIPKDGRSWQYVAESLLIDAIADAAGEVTTPAPKDAGFLENACRNRLR